MKEEIMRKSLAVLLSLIANAGSLHAETTSPPAAAPAKPVTSEIKKRTVYRINNSRYERIETEKGVVYIPSTGIPLEAAMKQAVCQQYFGKDDEMIRIRDVKESDPEFQKHEEAIVAMTATCQKAQAAQAKEDPTPVNSTVKVPRKRTRAESDEK